MIGARRKRVPVKVTEADIARVNKWAVENGREPFDYGRAGVA